MIKVYYKLTLINTWEYFAQGVNFFHGESLAHNHMTKY